VIVGVTSLLLALNPNRSSTVFNTFRLTGVVAIAVTDVVFHAVLARLLCPSGTRQGRGGNCSKRTAIGALRGTIAGHLARR